MTGTLSPLLPPWGLLVNCRVILLVAGIWSLDTVSHLVTLLGEDDTLAGGGDTSSLPTLRVSYAASWSCSSSDVGLVLSVSLLLL